MIARYNLETEGGELVPFESAAALFAYVERRMERTEDDEDGEE